MFVLNSHACLRIQGPPTSGDQKNTGNTSEPELDLFLRFALECGHAAPDYLGTKFRVAFRAVISQTWLKNRGLHTAAIWCGATVEATQGQIDGFFRQLPYKCHQNRVASVGDWI